MVAYNFKSQFVRQIKSGQERRPKDAYEQEDILLALADQLFDHPKIVLSHRIEERQT